MHERLDAGVADAEPHGCQDERENGGGKLLEALVSVRMVLVGLAASDAVANIGDGGGEHVGGRVNGVGYEGHRIAQDAGDELERGKKDITAYAHDAQARDDLVARGGLVIGCCADAWLDDMGDFVGLFVSRCSVHSALD